MEGTKMIKLTIDNNVITKSSVLIPLDEVEMYAKKYFNWRTPTKYNSYLDRLYAQGSSKYDAFINYLIRLGY